MSSNDVKTVPVPPEDAPEPLDDAAYVRETYRIVKRMLKERELDRHEIVRHGGVLENHEGRIKTLEDQVTAGVHKSSDESVPSHLSPPPPGFIAALPPMRDRSTTHASINALAMEQARTAAETAKQTPLIEEAAKQTAEMSKVAKDQLQAKKEGNARIAGIALGAFVVYLLQSQSCAMPHFKGAPAPQAAPAMTAPAALPPATK